MIAALLVSLGASALSLTLPCAVEGDPPPSSPPPEAGLELTANWAVVSDYRGRGVSISDKKPALQGAIDLKAPFGLSAGAWGSSIANVDGASFELDLYGAKSFTLGETELSLGATAFVFPGGDGLNYGEAQASLARSLGPVDMTVGVNYGWRQANLGDDDNIYLFVNGAAPIGDIAGLPLTLNAGFGHERGALAVERRKSDWSLGLATTLAGFDIGASYIATDLSDPAGSGTAVLSFGRGY